MIDNRLIITKDLVIIFPVCLNMTLTICYTFTVCIWSDRREQTVYPDETPQNAASHLVLHCLPLIQLFSDTTLGSKLFKFQIKYAKELRCPNTKGKHGKVTDTEIK